MQIDIPEFPWSPYALFVILAVAIGFAVAVITMRGFGIKKQTIFYTCLLAFICTIVTSLIIGFKWTSDGPYIGFSGLGAAVGMIGGIFISALIIKDRPDIVMASFVASSPLMYGLAKFGCLFAGCCHGKEYYGPFAIVYHGEHEGSYFPAQIIDMISFVIIFIISSILIRKLENKVRAIYIIFAILIPVRFALEYLRYYHDGSLIASGQITVLIAGAAALILITIWKAVLKINYR